MCKYLKFHLIYKIILMQKVTEGAGTGVIYVWELMKLCLKIAIFAALYECEIKNEGMKRLPGVKSENKKR